jgi:hypothetical protein
MHATPTKKETALQQNLSLLALGQLDIKGALPSNNLITTLSK